MERRYLALLQGRVSDERLEDVLDVIEYVAVAIEVLPSPSS